MRLFQQLAMIAFLILSLIVAVYVFMQRNKPTIVASAQSAPQVDEIMLGVEAKQFDATGQLKQIISSQSVTHIQGENTSSLEHPHLTMYQKDGALWTLTALKGTSHQSGIGSKITQVDLSEDVEVHYAAADKQNWAFSTYHLKIDPLKKWISTEDPVIVKSDNMVLQAQGMQAQLDQRQVQFLKRVTTNYELPKT